MTQGDLWRVVPRPTFDDAAADDLGLIFNDAAADVEMQEFVSSIAIDYVMAISAS